MNAKLLPRLEREIAGYPHEAAHLKLALVEDKWYKYGSHFDFLWQIWSFHVNFPGTFKRKMRMLTLDESLLEGH